MQAMHAAGMSSYAILASATRNVAAHIGVPSETGTVAPGAKADLVLLKGNPLEDIGNVARQAGVMVAGRWFSEDEIAKRLDDIAATLRQ
jgi:imidazolonepropionase-like amidohydrolase